MQTAYVVEMAKSAADYFTRFKHICLHWVHPLCLQYCTCFVTRWKDKVALVVLLTVNMFVSSFAHSSSSRPLESEHEALPHPGGIATL